MSTFDKQVAEQEGDRLAKHLRATRWKVSGKSPLLVEAIWSVQVLRRRGGEFAFYLCPAECVRLRPPVFWYFWSGFMGDEITSEFLVDMDLFLSHHPYHTASVLEAVGLGASSSSALTLPPKCSYVTSTYPAH